MNPGGDGRLAVGEVQGGDGIPGTWYKEPFDTLGHGTTLGRPFEAFRVPTKIV